MRKRIKVSKKFKTRTWVVSCNGTKMLRSFFALSLIVVMTTSCASHAEPLSEWESYCLKYGVNVENPTEIEENYFLDAYVGGVEAEYDQENGYVEYIREFDPSKIQWWKKAGNDYVYLVYDDPENGYEYIELKVDLRSAGIILQALRNHTSVPNRLISDRGVYKFPNYKLYENEKTNENNRTYSALCGPTSMESNL